MMFDPTYFPERLKSPVPMTVPNQQIPIHSGTLYLIAETIELTIEGTILYSWLPSPKIQFSGHIKSGPPIQDWYKAVNFNLWINGVLFGEAVFTFRELTTGFVKGTCLAGVCGNKQGLSKKIQFAIPNLREFWGQVVQELTDEKLSSENARIDFLDDTFEIIIDKVKGHKGYRESLANEGGYMLLYAGEIIKKDNSEISWEEWERFHRRFSFFLYFINGARTAPLFATGINGDSVVWRDYTPYHIDLYQYANSWANMIKRDLFKESWNTWTRLWSDHNDQNFLQTAVHWYVEANTQQYIECAIVLAQNALELIYNWLIVERLQLINARNARQRSAVDKIRQLLAQINVSSSIPTTFQRLAAMQGASDGAEAFVSIRNALVHGNRTKRQRLATITIEMQYEALQIALWYIELALLYILEHSGNYRNRVAGNAWLDKGEKVPWAP